MPVQHAVEPLQHRPVVSEESIADAVGIHVRPRAGVDVVVHLEESEAEVRHEPVDDTVEVRAGGGMPEVEVEAVVLDDALAVALEERLRRQAVGEGAADADHLGLEPEPGDHALGVDGVDDLAQPPGEAGGRRHPFADGVPPVPRVVVPAGVDAEHLGADLGGRADEGEELLRGGVAVERVHVVVEDDRHRGVVGVRAPRRATMIGQCRHGAGGIRGEGDRHGHARERLGGGEDVRPCRIGVGRPGQGQVAAGGVLPDLPAPRAVVLDLPGQGQARGAGLQDAGGQSVRRRPRPRRHRREGAARVVAREVLGEGHEVRAAQRSTRPPPLAEPVALAGHPLPVRERVAGRVGGGESGGPGSDRPEDDTTGTDVGERDGAGDGRDAVADDEGEPCLQVGGALPDDEGVHAVARGLGVVDVPHPQSELGVGEAPRGGAVTRVGGEDLDERDAVDRKRPSRDAHGAADHGRVVVPVERQCDQVGAPLEARTGGRVGGGGVHRRHSSLRRVEREGR